MAHLERDPVTGETVTVANPVEARQGRRGTPVLYVLVAGLALALIAWAAVSMYRPEPGPSAPAVTAPSAPAPASPAQTAPTQSAPATPAPPAAPAN